MWSGFLQNIVRILWKSTIYFMSNFKVTKLKKVLSLLESNIQAILFKAWVSISSVATEVLEPI